MSVPRDIHIKPVLNGYLVTVGCQTLAYNYRSEMLRDLADYLEHPDVVEKEAAMGAIHKELIGPLALPPVPCDPAPTDDRCCQGESCAESVVPRT